MDVTPKWTCFLCAQPAPFHSLASLEAQEKSGNTEIYIDGDYKIYLRCPSCRRCFHPSWKGKGKMKKRKRTVDTVTETLTGLFEKREMQTAKRHKEKMNIMKSFIDVLRGKQDSSAAHSNSPSASSDDD
ncbi:uncharacterized protein LOC117316056 [Pecten maximus]|uniref:uncharacterized protein LOC117316056 n=1 Tax=Pecten maximus TaxID=6579 RepID=UPI0014581B20|nr:uncharacterized protein LOC117316056 [Pecten maximus]